MTAWTLDSKQASAERPVVASVPLVTRRSFEEHPKLHDLVVRNGTVVTPNGVGQFDVGVVGECIANVGTAGTLKGSRVIDATSQVVVPGGIEPHAHLAHPIMAKPSQRMFSLGPEDDTIGMAFGGVTTHLDFLFHHPGSSSLTEALAARVSRWRGRSYVDYSFHIAFVGLHPPASLDEIPDLVDNGYPTIKIFTTNVYPRHPRRPRLMLGDKLTVKIMQIVAKAGALLLVHGEDDDLIQANYRRFQQDGRTDPTEVHRVHSEIAEEIAFDRIIRLAEGSSAAVYFVHTSSQGGTMSIGRARSRGLPVYGETLHGYLCRTADDYRHPRGACFHTYPSLRSQTDQDALWRGLTDGTLSTTGTDELPTTLEVKMRGRTVRDITGGNLGAEARMGVLFSEAVGKRGMSLSRFVDITSTNAAKLLGLYPRKGVIAPGSDADLVVLNPAVTKTLQVGDFHVSDYSPWEGWQVQGWPSATILRGKPIVLDGRFLGSPADGRLIRRKIEADLLRRPLV